MEVSTDEQALWFCLVSEADVVADEVRTTPVHRVDGPVVNVHSRTCATSQRSAMLRRSGSAHFLLYYFHGFI